MHACVATDAAAEVPQEPDMRISLKVFLPLLAICASCAAGVSCKMIDEQMAKSIASNEVNRRDPSFQIGHVDAQFQSKTWLIVVWSKQPKLGEQIEVDLSECGQLISFKGSK
jgi:hypothetical protein